MTTVLVYRPSLVTIDRNGDPIDADGNVIRDTSPQTYLGEIDVLIFDPTVSDTSRGTDTNTAGGNPQSRGGPYSQVDLQIGVPQDGAIKPLHGDILVTDYGAQIQIYGPRLYTGANPLRGDTFPYYWLHARAVI